MSDTTKSITYTKKASADSHTIRCYLDASIVLRPRPVPLSGARLLAAQALQLLIRLDFELRGARADWNQDRFRRVMQARAKSVSRVFRRWSKLDPPPSIRLGTLRRHYHANLAGHLYKDTK